MTNAAEEKAAPTLSLDERIKAARVAFQDMEMHLTELDSTTAGLVNLCGQRDQSEIAGTLLLLAYKARDAYDALQKLWDKAFEPVVCGAPTTQRCRRLQDKLEFFEDHVRLLRAQIEACE